MVALVTVRSYLRENFENKTECWEGECIFIIPFFRSSMLYREALLAHIIKDFREWILSPFFTNFNLQIDRIDKIKKNTFHDFFTYNQQHPFFKVWIRIW